MAPYLTCFMRSAVPFFSKQTSAVKRILQKGLMTSSFNAEKAMESLQKNPYYEKYSQKFAALQSSSPDEFCSKLEEFEKQKVIPKIQPEERYFSSSASPKPKVMESPFQAYTKQKVLNDVMKTDLIRDKSAEEIKQIWEEYYTYKDGITATIPGETYDVLFQRSQEFPTFIFPLPRSQGYEFIVCQFCKHEAHFTSLINYQAYKENAPECLTIIFYPDLKEEKEIVLMHGTYDKDVLNVSEAQCLANQLQLYYAQNNEKRLQIIQRFTKSPDEFKYMDLVAELECLSL